MTVLIYPNNDTPEHTEANFLANISEDLRHPGCKIYKAHCAGGRTNRYRCITIGNKKIGAHCYAWFRKHGYWSKLEICHHCDVPACVEITHLFEGTHADNMHDRDRKHRNNAPRGERHRTHTHPDTVRRGDNHPSRLHPERVARGDRQGRRTHPERFEHLNKLNKYEKIIIVKAYRYRLANQKELANQFGVADQTISAMCRAAGLKQYLRKEQSI